MITRNNYEEFFLLYVDNELPASDKKAVEAFVRENPDLEAELNRLQQSVFKPDGAVIFENKDRLMKQTADSSFINAGNYEEYFLLYTDKELDEATAKEVETFAGQHPSLSESLHLLLQARLEPDTAIVFEGKEILYKKEEDDKVILFPWARVAAAAIVLLLAGFFVFTNRNHDTPPIASAGGAKTGQGEKNSSKNIPAEKKKDQPAVTSFVAVPLDNTGNTKKEMAAKETIQGKQLTQYIAGNQKQYAQETGANTNHPAADLPEENRPVKINTIARAEVGTANTGHGLVDSTLTAVPGQFIAETGKRADAVKEEREDINYMKKALEENNMANADEFYIANTTTKKNKLRGIFRKVSRVFDKNANADDDNKHGVMIGGFQIALK